MTFYARSGAFWDLVGSAAQVRKIGTGFTFTEGPIWHPVRQDLLFSDMPGDVRRCWDPKGGVREVMRPANKCNGMTYDAELNLIVCEHSTSSLIRETVDGRREVLASHFEGQELNSPNDTVVRSDGSIYFSDPWYGRMPVFGVERERELGWQGVFRVPPGGGDPQLVVGRDDFDMPNGLCFSPDESVLYINDTTRASIRVYDVNADGSLRNGRLFAEGIISETEEGVPDGMKCDEQGNVWVTAPGGVWVFAPTGEHMGVVRVPELVANLGWGGGDWHTLYMCASTSVYAVETRVGPRVEPYMRSRAQGAASPEPPQVSAAPAAASPSPPSQPAAAVASGGVQLSEQPLRLDASRCALLIQDMQNDVIMDGGAFADSGAPDHARQQNVIANSRRLADHCRARGIPVIHIWFQCDPGGHGMTQNAPLFAGAVEANAMVRGTWGGAPVEGLERQPGDYLVEKMRMSAWEGSNLETILKATGRDVLIDTGAWTNMSIEHTARTGADKGYTMIVPEDCCSTMNQEWHLASVNFAMQNVATVTNCDTVIAALGG